MVSYQLNAEGSERVSTQDIRSYFGGNKATSIRERAQPHTPPLQRGAKPRAPVDRPQTQTHRRATRILDSDDDGSSSRLAESGQKSLLAQTARSPCRRTCVSGAPGRRASSTARASSCAAAADDAACRRRRARIGVADDGRPHVAAPPSARRRLASIHFGRGGAPCRSFDERFTRPRVQIDVDSSSSDDDFIKPPKRNAPPPSKRKHSTTPPNAAAAAEKQKAKKAKAPQQLNPISVVNFFGGAAASPHQASKRLPRAVEKDAIATTHPESESSVSIVPETPPRQQRPKVITNGHGHLSPRKSPRRPSAAVSPDPSIGSVSEASQQARAASPDVVVEQRARRRSPRKSAAAEGDGGARQSLDGGFRGFLQREGPRALGSKPLPHGATECLRGRTFVLSGVLESVTRDDAKALVERHGGRVTVALSQRTHFLVAGRDAGASKLDKANKFNTAILDEDGLFELIRTAPAQAPLKSATAAAKTALKSPPPNEPAVSSTDSGGAEARTAVSDVWVDRYRPTALRHLVGQHGDKSPVNKLLHWLRNWQRHHLGAAAHEKKPRPPPWKQDDGAASRAALLSGPPGVGKTSAAALCCGELGLAAVELNASDTRNRKCLAERVAQLTLSHQMDEFFIGHRASQLKSQHVIIMDEVDGMSGNEDRAGMQELIALIKSTKVPIICICNDRQSQKIRSLANHCFDLRFQRPRVEQIRGRLLTICAKERLQVTPQALDQLIEGANHDIRQTIHHLSLLCADQRSLDFDTARDGARQARKDVAINVFEAARQALSARTEQQTLADKSELFFADYSLMPLFMQENYVHVVPNAAKSELERMELLSVAADSLSTSDRVETLLRRTQNWSLLPDQAFFSTVYPMERLSGYMRGQVAFPRWLGNNSTRGRRARLLQQLHSHMCLRVSGTDEALVGEYAPALRAALLRPLERDGAAGATAALQVYAAYDLTRDDADALHELAQWPGAVDAAAALPAKVKAAMTRAYNKQHQRLPYAAVGAAASKRRAAAATGADLALDPLDEGGDVLDDEAEDGGDSDADVPVKIVKRSDASNAPNKRRGKQAVKRKP